MIVKSTLLAVLLFIGSVTLAGAQGTESSVPLGTSKMGQTTNGAITQAIIGWNYLHVAACTVFSGTFVLIAQEDGSTWYTSDLITTSALSAACQTNHWVAFHVINFNGAWDQAYVYPF